jgi:hypothetical protein
MCLDMRPKPGLKLMYFGMSRCHLCDHYTNFLLPEGDGARSFSELVILKRLMSELKTMKYPEEPEKVMLPCKEFSMIGGRGAGGYVLGIGLECISNLPQSFCDNACETTHVR